MCNHYEHLSADEIIGLLQHYKLLGMSWSEAMHDYLSKSNRPRDLYPKQQGPVLIVENGELVFETMGWGMPGPIIPPKTRPNFVTNARELDKAMWKPWLQAAEVVYGSKKHRGGRCLVPASAFAEPDGRTSNPVIERWFARADGKPFFFAGFWREWYGDIGTVRPPNPDIGTHRRYAFLTTEPNATVKPVHEKAMPVLLLSPEDVKAWLYGTAADALKLQKPAPADAVVIVERKKKD